MRIEKGHVAGNELNGTTTAADLGLGRMMSKKKDFIGRVLAKRPGLTDPERPSLSAMRPVDRSARLYAGAPFSRAGRDAQPRERSRLSHLGGLFAHARPLDRPGIPEARTRAPWRATSRVLPDSVRAMRRSRWYRPLFFDPEGDASMSETGYVRRPLAAGEALSSGEGHGAAGGDAGVTAVIRDGRARHGHGEQRRVGCARSRVRERFGIDLPQGPHRSAATGSRSPAWARGRGSRSPSGAATSLPRGS